MKNKKVRFFLILVLLIITGCTYDTLDLGKASDSEIDKSSVSEVIESPITGYFSEEPSNLYVTYNDHTYEAVRGTFSWSFDLGNGFFSGVEADSGGPGELVRYQSEEIYVDEGGVITLDFDEEMPDSYNVVVWQDFDDTAYVSVDKNHQIALPSASGKVIYEVHASWVQGDAYYAFEVSYPEETNESYEIGEITFISRYLDPNDQLSQANKLVLELAKSINDNNAQKLLELKPYLDTDLETIEDCETILADLQLYLENGTIHTVAHRNGDFIKEGTVAYDLATTSGRSLNFYYQPESFDLLFNEIIRRSKRTHELMDSYVLALKEGNVDAISQMTWVDGEEGKPFSDQLIEMVLTSYEEDFDIETIGWRFTGKFQEGGVYDCYITGTKDGEQIERRIGFSRYYESLSIVDSKFKQMSYDDGLKPLTVEDIQLIHADGHIFFDGNSFSNPDFEGMLGDFTSKEILKEDWNYMRIQYEKGMAELTEYEGSYWLRAFEVRDPTFVTPRGLKVGDNISRLWELYSAEDVHSDYEGGFYGDTEMQSIYFDIKDDKISSIKIIAWMD